MAEPAHGGTGAWRNRRMAEPAHGETGAWRNGRMAKPAHGGTTARRNHAAKMEIGAVTIAVNSRAQSRREISTP